MSFPSPSPTTTTSSSSFSNSSSPIPWKHALSLLAATLWWGSLTVVGFMVVPQLFAHMDTPAQAGRMAARLFSTQTGLSCVCALVLLMGVRARLSDAPQEGASASHGLIWPVLGMMLALGSEFGVAPHIVARENLAFWHSLGSGLYLLQWVCAGAALWALWRERAL